MHYTHTHTHQPRGQLPLDLLRETRASERAPQRREKLSPADDSDTRLGRFLSKAKGAAKKSKEGLVAKYKAVKNRGKHEDSVELLPSNSSSEELRRTARAESSVRVERGLGAGHGTWLSSQPPKDLFDDL